MYDVSSRVFRLNGVEERINLSKIHSSSLQALSDPVDILVTETLDCAIFGERIVQTVLDAKDRLMAEDGIVIPSRAVALFALVESEDLARENFYEVSSDSVQLNG